MAGRHGGQSSRRNVHERPPASAKDAPPIRRAPLLRIGIRSLSAMLCVVGLGGPDFADAPGRPADKAACVTIDRYGARSDRRGIVVGDARREQRRRAAVAADGDVLAAHHRDPPPPGLIADVVVFDEDLVSVDRMAGWHASHPLRRVLTVPCSQPSVAYRNQVGARRDVDASRGDALRGIDRATASRRSLSGAV
jgi:hypothetical protein